MISKIFISLSLACLSYAVRENIDLSEELHGLAQGREDSEKPRWLGGKHCEDIVPRAKPSLFNWVRIRRCKCPAHYALKGPEKYCGDGTRALFRASFVDGRGCSCEPKILCPKVNTQRPFDLESYISGRWYSQQQMNIRYLPSDANNCVTAKYTKKESSSFWGYTLSVENHAEYDDGRPRGGEICAYSADKNDAAKLKVAPCWLPRFMAGPYWVLRYNEEKGYALISGGQPKVANVYGCRTGTGTNNAGLWIFTRAINPPASLINEVRQIAGHWFDLSVLKPVNHTGCKGVGYS